jgi:hypothetical protein
MTTAEHLVVKYASSGYSPGDTRELFVGPDHRILEYAYHRAVPVPPTAAFPHGVPSLVLLKWQGKEGRATALFD